MVEEDKKQSNKILTSKLFYYAIIALVVSAAVFLSYFTVKNLDVIIEYIVGIVGKFFGAITPLIIGIIFAYIFNRPIMFFERHLGKIRGKRVLSIAILYIIILGTISLAINFIVPGIQRNLIQLINYDLPNYSSSISLNFQQVLDFLRSLGITIDFSNMQDYIMKATNISSILLDWVMSFVKSLTQGVFNFVLALVLAFYILQGKEKLLGGIKEFIALYGGRRAKNLILAEAKGFNLILNNYITGMLIDAIIVTTLVTISLNLVGHRYFLLMGVTLGLLNLIPYFGAIIGCCLAVLLALFQGFPTALYTLIAIIIIQQIDGNIIQPKIVGERVGLEPLWVITAVIVFGSYLGLLGMLVAVPFMALIKVLLKRMIARKRESVKKQKENISEKEHV
jgi:predicted PurR-regulated permease PerM